MSSQDSRYLASAFISYASDDVQLAKYIESFLDGIFAGKLKIFIDVKIDTGELWRDKISKELDRSKIFILLVSNNSIKSINVAREVASVAAKCLRIKDDKPVWADSRTVGTLFLPIILEDVDSIFACIKQNVQCQDFRNPYDLRNQLEVIANSIWEHLGKPNIEISKSDRHNLDASNSYSFSEIVNRQLSEWLDNNYRKAQFASRVLRNPTIQLLAESNRKLDNFFELNNTSNVLLAPYTISHKEKATKAEVWVVSENLNNDLYDDPIIKSVQENMREKEIRYRYFIRESKKAHLSRQLSQKIPQVLHDKYQVTILPEIVLMPFEELVIYDPENEELRWGYMQMTYEGSRSNQPVFILCPSQLVDESVELLKSCYPRTAEETDSDIQATDIKGEKEYKDKEKKEHSLKNYLVKHIKRQKKNRKSPHIERLIKFFSDTGIKQKNQEISNSGIELLASYIDEHMMKREPLSLRANHNLYLEEQALTNALQLAWNSPIVSSTDVLRSEDDGDANFLGSFISKINDISSIKNAQDSLVTPEKIATQERAAKEEVMIISPLLYNDLYEQEVKQSISENIESILVGNRNLRYHYFYFNPTEGECGYKQLKGRDENLYHLRKEYHRVQYKKVVEDKLNFLNKKAESIEVTQHYDKIFHFYKIPHQQVLFPFNEMVVFDPNDNQCNWGYMQLNYGDQRAEKVFMKLPQRVLVKLCNILLRYKKYYVKN